MLAMADSQDSAATPLPPDLSVCLGVSGSVAAVKAPELASALLLAAFLQWAWEKGAANRCWQGLLF